MKKITIIFILFNFSILFGQFQSDLFTLQKGSDVLSFRPGDEIVLNRSEVIYDSIDPSGRQIKAWKGDDPIILNFDEINSVRYKLGGSKTASRFGKGLKYGLFGGLAFGVVLAMADGADFIDLLIYGGIFGGGGALVGSIVGGSSGAVSSNLSKPMNIKPGEWEIIIN